MNTASDLSSAVCDETGRHHNWVCMYDDHCCEDADQDDDWCDLYCHDCGRHHEDVEGVGDMPDDRVELPGTGRYRLETSTGTSLFADRSCAESEARAQGLRRFAPSGAVLGPYDYRIVTLAMPARADRPAPCRASLESPMSVLMDFCKDTPDGALVGAVSMLDEYLRMPRYWRRDIIDALISGSDDLDNFAAHDTGMALVVEAIGDRHAITDAIKGGGWSEPLEWSLEKWLGTDDVEMETVVRRAADIGRVVLERMTRAA